MDSRVVMREARWALFGLVAPSLVVHVGYVLVTQSPVPLGQRLVFGEDACPYLSCLLIGLGVFVLLSAGRLAGRLFAKRHGPRDAA